MNQESWEVEDAYTIVVEEDGDQGSGDSAKPLGGWLNLVSLPCLLSCWCRRCYIVRCICGRSQMYMTMMILRDLPHTCTCTWC